MTFSFSLDRLIRTSFFNRNFFIVLACDVLLLCASWAFAYLVRFDFDVPDKFEELMLQLLPSVILVKITCFYFFDVYKGMWRFTSVTDLVGIIKAATLSTLVIGIGIGLVFRFKHVPRSVVFIDWGLTILAIAGARLVIRLFFQKYVPTSPILSLSLIRNGVDAIAKPDIKRLLVVGAGSCGEKIVREIHDNYQLRYKVVGFLDDTPSKIGRKIHGIPVRGIIGDLKYIAEKTDADEVLIAIPSATSNEMRRIIAICKGSGLRFKTVPSYGELIGGKISFKTVREVAYRDLLGRAPIRLDERMIGDFLRGKRILVTGAGGSIGSELCRQICRFEPADLVLFERVENSLYEIELELKSDFKHLKIEPLLGDIQDREHLRRVFGKHRPEAVFHAAAYKHVPMLELQPWKAIENNIVGTRNLVEIAAEFECGRFVLVSTDKAVKPANVMGATKRVAEMITLNFNGCNLSRTRFMAVRFGNVVGSAGSVVPLFKRQIEAGGPVTVTHPNVTRFFMTIREASQLILQSAAMGEGGEIFILDMGTPVKIADMARDLIRLSGLEPDVDVRIEFTGLRPGEKMTEELITEGEDILRTRHEKILVQKATTCDLSLLNGKLDVMASAARDHDTENIKTLLKEIVNDYVPAFTEAGLDDFPNLPPHPQSKSSHIAGLH
jgi:FlaA1/EpsC-like NDP-sugar epimerase